MMNGEIGSWGTKTRNLLNAGIAVVALAAASPAFAKPVDFDIDAQPLGDALREFAQESGREILFSSDVVDGKRSTDIEGSYEPEDALERLLRGTGLRFTVTSRDAFLVQAASNSKSRADGRPEQSTTIVITGTNIRGVENPTAPVQSYDREAIERTGSASVEDFFRTVPQNFGSETQFVDNSQSTERSALNTSGGTGIDLRGAGAGSTLVLLNGRRLPASDFGAFVDISVMPLSVIEQIDIQTDGASAIYGSDAVAGVVNFITRKDYSGAEAFARYGTVTDGSLREYQAGAVAGDTWGTGGGLVSVEYTQKDPLLASERDYIEISTVNPVGSLSAEEEKYSAALSFNQEITDRLTFSTDVLYGNRQATRSQNTGGQFGIKTEQSNWFVSGRLDYELSDRWGASLYVDYGDAYSTSRYSDDDFQEESQRSNRLLVIEGKTSGALFDLPGGSVGFALGGLHREEAYDVGKDGDLSKEARRDVEAVYGELLVPVVGEGNAVPGVQAFDISVAGRYENYSDFGDSFTPKVGLHWRPTDSLAFRGTYSESFRAPLLEYTNGGRQILGFIRPVSSLTVAPPPPQDPRLDPGFFSYVFLAGANKDLQPESAKVWTGGFEFQPQSLDGLSVEGTYFNIDYSDRIESVGFFDVLGNPDYLSFLELNPSSETLAELVAGSEFFRNNLPFELTDPNIAVLGYTGLQNISRREISGMDLTASYLWKTGSGTFDASVNGTYLFDYKAQVTDTLEPQEQVGTVYRPVDFRVRGSLGWSLDGFSAHAAVNYTGGYQDNLSGPTDIPIDSYTTIDLLLSYDSGDAPRSAVLRNTKISLGVRNLFDTDPPFVDTSDGLNYDPANATPIGRLVTVRLSKSF